MPTAPTTWKLTLSYDGTGFHGWQVQPGRPTVQGTLAAAIQHLTGETVLPQGSGRTDAGVHALAQVASFSLTTQIPSKNLMHALNRALPPSIRILCAEAVENNFHARHKTATKAYEYSIFEGKYQPDTKVAERICPPFLAPYAWDCHWELNLAPMQQAADLLCGAHDFTSFAASDPDMAQREAGQGAPNSIKTLFSSAITRERDLLIYRVTGSGFLHHMVRNIVGTLVEIGRGAIPPTDIPAILAARSRSAAGPTAPPQGLFLVHVNYGDTGIQP